MAYWQAVRNKNLADKYDEWLQNQSMIIIPQKLQMRSIPDETENLRRRREQQVMDNYIAEKELLLLRCESQQIKYRETDSKMITDIESRSTGQIRKFLLSLWETQCKQNEEISHNRWLNRNLPWLSKYKENFLNRHQNENPYIRQSDDSRPLTYSQVLSKKPGYNNCMDSTIQPRMRGTESGNNEWTQQRYHRSTTRRQQFRNYRTNTHVSQSNTDIKTRNNQNRYRENHDMNNGDHGTEHRPFYQGKNGNHSFLGKALPHRPQR